MGSSQPAGVTSALRSHFDKKRRRRSLTLKRRLRLDKPSVQYTTGIKALPVEDRPRERMALVGASQLSNPELIAILLGSGTRDRSALGIAQDLLTSGGLRGLAHMSIADLVKHSGIGTVKACILKAALELGIRAASAEPAVRPVITSPADAASLLMAEMRYLDREVFKAMLLNTKNRVLSTVTISVGVLDSSLAHPREVFKEAIIRSAASVIVVHNHPSGEPEPSRQDIELTKRLRESGDLLGITVLDHIIIGDNRFVSLRERKLM